MKDQLCEKSLKPGQLFTVRNHIYQVVKGICCDQCKNCAARKPTRYRIGSEMKISYYCDTDFPICENNYFKLIK